MPSVLHLRPFRCKCFILKCGNFDKFESRSSDGILLGYTPHDRSYRVFNLETNTIIGLCDVTFDETTLYPRDVFKCAGDMEMDESIFVDEELHSFNDNENDPLRPSTSSSKSVAASTLKEEATQATTSFTTVVQASRIEGEIIFESGAPSHIQKAHSPQ
jgi:hypothetical protein